MSGYRAIHRTTISTESSSSTTPEPIPIWDASFLPSNFHGDDRKRFCICGVDGIVRLYSILDTNASLDFSNIKNSSDQNSGISTHLEYRLLGQDHDISSSAILGSCKVSVWCDESSAAEPGGVVVVASVSLDGMIRIWKIEGDKNVSSEENAEGMERTVKDLTPHLEVQVEKATGTSIALCEMPSGEITCAVGCLDGRLCLYTTALFLHPTEKNLAQMKEPTTTYHDPFPNSTTVTSISSRYSVPYLALGRKDGTVDMISLSYSSHDGIGVSKIHRFLYHHGPVRGLSFLHDGSLLLSGADDGRVNVYDVVTKKGGLVGSFQGHNGWVLSVEACPLGRRFATSSSDKTVKIWDLTTRQNVHTFDDGHLQSIWGITFSTDGKRLVSAGEDGVIQLYSVEGQ